MDDIRSFDNGLVVEDIIKVISENRDKEAIKVLFENAMKLDYIVPYKDMENELVVITSKEKGKMFPAFSSFSEFEKSGLPADRTKLMNLIALQKIVSLSNNEIKGIAVNPHGKSLVFENKNVVKNTSGNKINLSKPGFVPDYLKEAVCGFLSGCDFVYKAFVLWGQREQETTPHIFIIIDFDGDKESFLKNAAESIRPCLKNGESVEFAKADFKLLQIAEKISAPIYSK